MKLLRKRRTSLVNYNENIIVVYDVCIIKLEKNPNITQVGLEKINIKILNKLDNHFKRCSIREAKSIYNYTVSKKINKFIFGGKDNLLNYQNKKISRKEYLKNKKVPLCSLGEANQRGNRKFQIIDEATVLFKFSRNKHINIKLSPISKNYKKYINILYLQQSNNSIPITYKLDSDYIYIIFNEILINCCNRSFINNRNLALDLNPNYIGWSIIDWYDSSKFKIIRCGVYSIKDLNTQLLYKERVSNKKVYELIKIASSIIQLVKHYQCENLVIESLNIESGSLGDDWWINKLVNNYWHRKIFTNNLIKYCNLENINVIKVVPAYSSFIGNFLFRDLLLPDMILASIEISRRGYEYNLQYILKQKAIEHNIIEPNIYDFSDRYKESLHYFNVPNDIISFRKLYNFFKNSKIKYRVSLNSCNLKFFRHLSYKSLVWHSNTNVI